MSDIASKIAAEHRWLATHCSCGYPIDQVKLGLADQVDHYIRHIATVTEAAVRARIADDIEAHLVQHFADPLHDPEHEWHEGYQRAMEKAATGAREGAIPEEEPWP